MPAAIRDQRRGIHLRHDVGPGDRFRIVAARSIRTQISHRWLAIDLVAKVHHRAVEGLHQVRRLRRAIRMRRVHRRRAHRVVVITPAAAVIVTAFRIQRLPRRAIRLHKAIHRIAIQRPGDGLVIAQRPAEARVQVRGCDVVMVIIRQTAVTAVVVQLADLIRHIPAIVRRIEYRDAVRCQRHRAAQEIRRRSRWIVDHDGRCRRHRHQRDAPHIRLLIPERARVVLIARRMRKVSRRDRHLLLPRRDPEHLVWHPLRRVVRFEEKGRAVPVVAHLRLERRKRSRHQQPVPRWRQRRPARHERRNIERRKRSHLQRLFQHLRHRSLNGLHLLWSRLLHELLQNVRPQRLLVPRGQSMSMQSKRQEAGEGKKAFHGCAKVGRQVSGLVVGLTEKLSGLRQDCATQPQRVI